MKLVSLTVTGADTCGGLLDGINVPFRGSNANTNLFDPICLVGPNGTGKSQLLQVVAEIFHSVLCEFSPEEERGTSNDELFFELEYLISELYEKFSRVRISRKRDGTRKKKIKVEVLVDEDWKELNDPRRISELLPAKVIGYTSGDNETLSLPFFASRAGYADEVAKNAKNKDKKDKPIKDPRLMLIDYSTNLEVLVANLLLGSEGVKKRLIETQRLEKFSSFRCVVQLNHPAAPSGGVKLTQELQNYIGFMKKCSTCFEHNIKKNTYIFDFFIDESVHQAFSHYWPDGTLELYSCFHKLAMLNDLIIPKTSRTKFDTGIKDRRFASRLPEPVDEHKVFRFEKLEFLLTGKNKPVDYVSLSDGEHQLAQILGMIGMASGRNVLFLLDEPESHFNPRWRVEFIKMIRNFPTDVGSRASNTEAAQQECLLTTHSPFVPSDMQRENVLIFKKDLETNSIKVRLPEIQTYGSKFDAVLAECFEIQPPISALPRDEIDNLLVKGSAEEIKTALSNLGDSTARMRLAARLAALQEGKE